jgi:hypothetical protein
MADVAYMLERSDLEIVEIYAILYGNQFGGTLNAAQAAILEKVTRLMLGK